MLDDLIIIVESWNAATRKTRTTGSTMTQVAAMRQPASTRSNDNDNDNDNDSKRRGRRPARVVGCRKGVLSWSWSWNHPHPLTLLLAVLVVLWTSGGTSQFHPNTHLDTPFSSSSSSSSSSTSTSTSNGLCHARPWWSFPVACAQFARGRARLRTATATALEEELVNSTTEASLRINQYQQQHQQQQQQPSNPNTSTSTLQQILTKAGNKALGGGIPGMVAGVVQVTTSTCTTMQGQPSMHQRACKKINAPFLNRFPCSLQVLSLMWLRTIINYQCRYSRFVTRRNSSYDTHANACSLLWYFIFNTHYRYGTTFRDAWITLYKDGGIARFYRGMGFALLQTPLSRFGSTAANDGIQALVTALRVPWGPGRTTVLAAIVVGLWRIAIMPLDTCKTVLQVDSAPGFAILWRKVKAGNIGVLYQGAAAMAVAAMMGHYPWFYTYNMLSQSIVVESLIASSLLRNAVIGVMASVVSDTVVNSMRVIKTMKQTMGTKHHHHHHHGGLGYVETVRLVLATDGWRGLFGRGLQTRIFANGLQSLVFTVIWRGLAEYWKRKSEGRGPSGSTV
jgi:Mitochondrial carrier protein